MSIPTGIFSGYYCGTLCEPPTSTSDFEASDESREALTPNRLLFWSEKNRTKLAFPETGKARAGREEERPGEEERRGLGMAV